MSARPISTGPMARHHSSRGSAQSQGDAPEQASQASRFSYLEQVRFRNRTGERVPHNVGDLAVGRDVHIVYSPHHCTRCRKYFNADMSNYALPKAHYTHRVVALAVRRVVEDGLPDQAASWHLWSDHRVFVPYATIQNWVEAGLNKTHINMNIL